MVKRVFQKETFANTNIRCVNIENACGEYRRPLSFQLSLFGQPTVEGHRERSKLAAKMLDKSARKLEKSTLKAEKSRPGGRLDALGGDLGKKNVQEAVLADLGRFWTGAGCPKWRQDGRTWRQDGAKLAPRWSKMGLVWPSWHQLGSYL